MIATINPATGEIVARFDSLTESQLDEKLARAAEAFRAYRHTTFAERAAWMRRAAEILEAEKDAFGRIMTLEMGKPLAAARQEAAKCATACRYYVEHAARLLADELVETGGPMSFIRYQPIGAAQVRAVIDAPGVKAVTLTGSEPAGRQVAAQAGKQIKKCVLELGGSDPFVVMPSADLASAVRTALDSRVINNGQSCIAAKRFIVDESIAGEFEHRFVEAMAGLVVGDPMLEATEVGPLATPVILHQLDEQVRRSVAAGARVLTGGCRLERPGNYYSPTVLADAPENSPAYCEELFGPVAVVMRVRGIEAAIRLANDTRFGLGASAWTRDAAEQQRFIEEIDAGMVFINGMVASDPRLPFGGVKASGYGRELAAWGIREFVNVKTVVVL